MVAKTYKKISKIILCLIITINHTHRPYGIFKLLAPVSLSLHWYHITTCHNLHNHHYPSMDAVSTSNPSSRAGGNEPTQTVNQSNQKTIMNALTKIFSILTVYLITRVVIKQTTNQTKKYFVALHIILTLTILIQ